MLTFVPFSLLMEVYPFCQKETIMSISLAAQGGSFGHSGVGIDNGSKFSTLQFARREIKCNGSLIKLAIIVCKICLKIISHRHDNI